VAPQSRARRVLPLLLAGLRLATLRRRLGRTDAFIARNLDNAFLALFARWFAGSAAPLIYEVLDINPSCTGAGWQGRLLRRIEKWMLARTGLLVVSSPHFIAAYYDAMLQSHSNWLLFENKVPKFARFARPAAPVPVAEEAAGMPETRRWRIGWFGYLDDEQSWRILRRLAAELPDRVFVYVRGRPYTNFDMNRFLGDVAAMDNVVYGGPFRNPEDLAEMYEAVDIVWSVDLNAPAANSKWLLTNGIYEAGYFGKPVVGLAGTAVGQLLQHYGSGWCLSEPIEEQFISLVRDLTVEQYEVMRRTILAQQTERFVETDEIDRIWQRLQHQPMRRRENATRPPEVQPLS
jgi:succinoglycan biosynthesis protein ExoL